MVKASRQHFMGRSRFYRRSQKLNILFINQLLLLQLVITIVNITIVLLFP